MTAHWPQLLVLAWMAFRFAIACQRSGQKVEKTFKPTYALLDTMLLSAILWAGGRRPARLGATMSTDASRRALGPDDGRRG